MGKCQGLARAGGLRAGAGSADELWLVKPLLTWNSSWVRLSLAGSVSGSTICIPS